MGDKVRLQWWVFDLFIVSGNFATNVTMTLF